MRRRNDPKAFSGSRAPSSQSTVETAKNAAKDRSIAQRVGRPFEKFRTQHAGRYIPRFSKQDETPQSRRSRMPLWRLHSPRSRGPERPAARKIGRAGPSAARRNKRQVSIRSFSQYYVPFSSQNTSSFVDRVGSGSDDGTKQQVGPREQAPQSALEAERKITEPPRCALRESQNRETETRMQESSGRNAQSRRRRDLPDVSVPVKPHCPRETGLLVVCVLLSFFLPTMVKSGRFMFAHLGGDAEPPVSERVQANLVDIGWRKRSLRCTAGSVLNLQWLTCLPSFIGKRPQARINICRLSRESSQAEEDSEISRVH